LTQLRGLKQEASWKSLWEKAAIIHCSFTFAASGRIVGVLTANFARFIKAYIFSLFCKNGTDKALMSQWQDAQLSQYRSQE
jgi:hypothetical protein